MNQRDVFSTLRSIEHLLKHRPQPSSKSVQGSSQFPLISSIDYSKLKNLQLHVAQSSLFRFFEEWKARLDEKDQLSSNRYTNLYDENDPEVDFSSRKDNPVFPKTKTNQPDLSSYNPTLVRTKSPGEKTRSKRTLSPKNNPKNLKYPNDPSLNNRPPFVRYGRPSSSRKLGGKSTSLVNVSENIPNFPRNPSPVLGSRSKISQKTKQEADLKPSTSKKHPVKLSPHTEKTSHSLRVRQQIDFCLSLNGRKRSPSPHFLRICCLEKDLNEVKDDPANPLPSSRIQRQPSSFVDVPGYRKVSPFRKPSPGYFPTNISEQRAHSPTRKITRKSTSQVDVNVPSLGINKFQKPTNTLVRMESPKKHFKNSNSPNDLNQDESSRKHTSRRKTPLKRSSKSFVNAQTGTEEFPKSSVGVDTRNKFNAASNPLRRNKLSGSSNKVTSKLLKFINTSNSSESEDSVVKAIRLVSKLPTDIGYPNQDDDVSQPELSETFNRSDDEKSTSTFDHSPNDSEEYHQNHSKQDEDPLMDRSISNSTFDFDHMNFAEPTRSKLESSQVRNGSSQQDKPNLDDGSSLLSDSIPPGQEFQPPKLDIRDPNPTKNFGNLSTSDDSSLKISESLRISDSPKNSENLKDTSQKVSFKTSDVSEEDLPDILKHRNITTEIFNPNALSSASKTTTTTTTKTSVETDYFVSSRTNFKGKEGANFSSTTASDEDVFEGFPHRYEYLNNKKTEPYPHPQRNSMYLNSSDSVFQTSDSPSVGMTDYVPADLPVINE